MEHSQLTWEEVSQYEEIPEYGQQVWRRGDDYYFVTEEGGIAAQRVVYELPTDLFQMLESGQKNLGDIHFYLRNNNWPPKVTQEEANKNFWRGYPDVLKTNKKVQKYFTRKELEELLPEGSTILACSDE